MLNGVKRSVRPTKADRSEWISRVVSAGEGAAASAPGVGSEPAGTTVISRAGGRRGALGRAGAGFEPGPALELSTFSLPPRPRPPERGVSPQRWGRLLPTGRSGGSQNPRG